MGIAHYFSRKSRAHTGLTDERFLGEEKEWLIIYCKERLKKEQYDYMIFGHRHLPIDFKLSNPGGLEESRYINLGDWIKYFSYAVFDGKDLELLYYTSPDK